MVVKLEDVINIDNFLDTSKRIFLSGLKSCDFLGFVQISGLSTVIPYIVKEVTCSNLDQQKSSSSIASPLSNLSIKRTESKDKSLNMQLEDLKYDDLDGILNEEDNLNEKATFNENSLTDLDDQNLNSNFSNNNLDNQLENIIYELDNELNDNESRTETTTTTYYPQPETSMVKKRFVPALLVEKLLEFNDSVEKIDLNEWDCSYLKMICYYCGYDKLAEKLKANSKTTTNSNEHLSTSEDLKLICLNDLKWSQNQVPMIIKDCDLNPSSDLSPSNQYTQFNPLNHNQQQSYNNNYISTTPAQPCFNFAANVDNLSKKSQSFLSNHNYFNAPQQPLSNYTSTTPIAQHSFNFRTTMDNLNLKKSQSMLSHHNSNNNNSFYNQQHSQSQSSIQNLHHKKSTLTKESTSCLDNLFNKELTSNSLSFNNLNSNNLAANYTASKQQLGHHQTPKTPDQYLNNSNNFTNCNKNYGLPILNSTGINSIQNTTNSSLLNELTKCFSPSNGSTSVNNQIMNSNLNYSLNNLNNNRNNLSMINNLGLQSTFNTYQTSNNDSSIKISSVAIDNMRFQTFSLKSYSDTQAVLLSEIEKQMFSGIGLSHLRYYLESTFDIILYDYTR